MAQRRTAEPDLSREDRRTLHVALAYWQERLAQQPALCATPGGHAEWERTTRLLAKFS